MKRLFALGLCAGLAAGIFTVLSGPMKFVVFIFFMGMTTYFSSGGGTKGMVKSLAANVTGVLWAWLIVAIAGVLGGIPGALGIAVFIVVLVLCMCAKVDLLSHVPGVFIGCSMYFGNNFDMVGTLYALLLGVVIGWIADLAAAKFGDMIDPPQQ